MVVQKIYRVGWEFWICLLIILSGNDSEPACELISYEESLKLLPLESPGGEAVSYSTQRVWHHGVRQRGASVVSLGPRELTAVSKGKFWSPGRCLSWTSYVVEICNTFILLCPFWKRSMLKTLFPFFLIGVFFRKWNEYSWIVVISCCWYPLGTWFQLEN